MNLRTPRARALILIAGISMAWAAGATAAEKTSSWKIASPDGRLTATLALATATAAEDADPSEVNDGQLSFSVQLGAGDAAVEAIAPSPLGLFRDDTTFEKGLRLVSAGKPETIDESYTLLHGKRSACHVQANQQSFVFRNAQKMQLEVVFRVSNDGVAFRYRMPGPSGKAVRVLDELSGFRLTDAEGWLQPYGQPTDRGPAYEEYFQHVASAESGNVGRVAFPALFRVGGGKAWVLLTEADIDGAYCGSHLQRDHGGVYRLTLPDASEGLGRAGQPTPSGILPWATPWRVAVVAPTLGGIVESTLVTDLSPPSRVADASWIKPGRASWSWWSDHPSPRNFESLKEFVDLAAEMGWEYSLVDANWDQMKDGSLRQLADYARQRNVGLWLWYNSGGEHNNVSERPRGLMVEPNIRQAEFKLLKEWGIVGVKVDFFQTDKPEIMQQYQGILADAAAAGIMVNCHGCTIPRGWSRTWPNLMSMEAVRGAECYTFDASYPIPAPTQNTILPFTRNAIGPMDYTPCTFSDDRYPHLTTNAHELALSVVFESGVLHLADRASAYRALPEAAKQFLRDVPAAWDETRFLAGEPGKLAAIARRKGDDWFIGVVNGEKTAKSVTLPLDFLGAKAQQGVVIGDGATARSMEDRRIRRSDTAGGGAVTLELLPYGGAAMHFKP